MFGLGTIQNQIDQQPDTNSTYAKKEQIYNTCILLMLKLLYLIGEKLHLATLKSTHLQTNYFVNVKTPWPYWLEAYVDNIRLEINGVSMVYMYCSKDYKSNKQPNPQN